MENTAVTVAPELDYSKKLNESFFFYYDEDVESLKAWLRARGFNADAKFTYFDPFLIVSLPARNICITKGQRIEYAPGAYRDKFLLITTSDVETI